MRESKIKKEKKEKKRKKEINRIDREIPLGLGKLIRELLLRKTYWGETKLSWNARGERGGRAEIKLGLLFTCIVQYGMAANEITNLEPMSCQIVTGWHGINLFTRQHQTGRHEIDMVWHSFQMISVFWFWCPPLVSTLITCDNLIINF